MNNNSNGTGKYLLMGGGLLAFLLLIGYGVTYIKIGPLTVGLTPPKNNPSTAINPPPSFDTNNIIISLLLCQHLWGESNQPLWFQLLKDVISLQGSLMQACQYM